MRPLGRWGMGIGCLLIAVLALGPRVSVDAVPPAPSVPDSSLDAYLAASESAYDDITPGAEKTIQWARAAGTKTPLSMVYVHGFSATRQEVAPLCDTLAARLGANLFYTRLSGHGRPGKALGRATATDWLRDTQEALAIGKRLGDQVILVGTSTGATLALWAAAELQPESLAALVLLSPNLRPRDPSARVLTWPWGATVARLMVGSHRTWTPHNEQQARYWTTRYPVEVLPEMMALVDLVNDQSLDAIRVPTLVLYDPDDEVISIQAIQERLSAVQTSMIERDTVRSNAPSHHVIAGDIVAPTTTHPVAQRIQRFFRSRLSPAIE